MTKLRLHAIAYFSFSLYRFTAALEFTVHCSFSVFILVRIRHKEPRFYILDSAHGCFALLPVKTKDYGFK